MYSINPVNGFQVIRHTDQYLAVLGSHMVIAQTLLQTLSLIEGLTRGGGMTEHQKAVWTMSTPVSITTLCKNDVTLCTRHKDASAPRMARDQEDLAKLAVKFLQQFTFSDEE